MISTYLFADGPPLQVCYSQGKAKREKQNMEGPFVFPKELEIPHRARFRASCLPAMVSVLERTNVIQGRRTGPAERAYSPPVSGFEPHGSRVFKDGLATSCRSIGEGTARPASPTQDKHGNLAWARVSIRIATEGVHPKPAARGGTSPAISTASGGRRRRMALRTRAFFFIHSNGTVRERKARF